VLLPKGKTMKPKTSRIVVSAVALFLTIAADQPQQAAACEECQLRKEGTYLGQFTLMGNGTVRSFVTYGKNGKPSSLGVTFSESALSGLPEKLPASMPMWEYALSLPPEARVTGFDHISLDWSPQGHEPNGIYTKPHFDVHFYLTSRAERKKITFQGVDKVAGARRPAARFLPAGYVLPPGTAIPNMGAHAIDAAAPELTGKGFTHTFVYGYYKGQVNFMEPMVTKAFLETKPNVTIPVKQPTAYFARGYYPTSYSMKYDAVRQEYTVSLDGLTLREALRRSTPSSPTAHKTSLDNQQPTFHKRGKASQRATQATRTQAK
jgi:hypothetical protein